MIWLFLLACTDDGSTDDSGPCETFWYADADADGFGDDATAWQGCAPPPDRIPTGGDCDDGDPDVHPGAIETCLTLYDDDCDGESNTVDADGCRDWFQDADEDGYGAGEPLCACEAIAPYLTNNASDCDDTNAEVSPAQDEVCNDGVDNDCSDDPGECSWTGEAVLEDVGARLTGQAGDDAGYRLTYATLSGIELLVVSTPSRSDTGGVWLLELPVAAGAIADHGLELAGEPGDYAGWSVSAVTDLDGDGLGELAVGAPLGDAVYVIDAMPGEDGQLSDGRQLSGEGYFGAALDGRRDPHGDGLADLAIGAPSRGNAGAVELWSAPLDSPWLELTGGAGDELGASVSWLDDLDGDGLSELAVGAPGSDEGGGNAGSVRVWAGDAGTWGQLPDFTLTGEVSGDQAGASVVDGGDLDGDGRGDLLIGAPGAESGAGAVYLLTESPSGDISLFYARAALIGGAEERLGTSATPLGDVDGDGTGDFAVAGPTSSRGEVLGGVVAVAFGPHGGKTSVDDAGFLATGPGLADQVGESLSALDADKDGWTDLLVGARGDDTGGSGAGAVWLLLDSTI